MILQDKSGIRGRVRAVVISLDPVGLAKLEDLRRKYGDPAPDIKTKNQGVRNVRHEYRKNPGYQVERDAIYKEHGFRKKRTTWNIQVFLAMWQCAIRGKFEEVRNVFRYEMGINHNIVTDEGDAMVADIMAETPARVKVDGTNGHIAVGTGWTGTTPKQNTAVNTPTGSPEILDSPYPQLKGAWGAANDNITQYRSTFEAGDLNQVGIDEAGLGNNAVEATGDCLAYGQITPAVDVGSSDTLQVDWELTYLGA